MSLCREIFLVFLSAAYGVITLQISLQLLHVESNKFWSGSCSTSCCKFGSQLLCFISSRLSGEQNGSSHGSSSSQSPGGFGSPITAEEKRLRDKKHLNDITAARLPPLHHSPAKLLSIEESIAIQIQQKEAYEVRIYDLV